MGNSDNSYFTYDFDSSVPYSSRVKTMTITDIFSFLFLIPFDERGTKKNHLLFNFVFHTNRSILFPKLLNYKLVFVLFFTYLIKRSRILSLLFGVNIFCGLDRFKDIFNK